MGASIAKSLVKLILADNQFNDDDEVLKAIEFCFENNTTLKKYDFRYNNITENGLKTMTRILTEKANHVFEIEIPERIDDKETFKEFREALALNKPRKGKKKKGKGKKKKN